MNRLRIATCALIAPLALAGCTERPRIALPPAELATCADEPAPPALPLVDWTSVDTAKPVQQVRDNLMLSYVLAFRSAWGDCSSKVAGLRAWREAAK